MEPEVRDMLDAVVDEPTPGFLDRLETRLSTMTHGDPESPAPVIEVPLTTAPVRRRWPRVGLVAATTLATVAAVVALANRRDDGSTTEPPPTSTATTPVTQPTPTTATTSTATTATTASASTTTTTAAPPPSELVPSAYWRQQAPGPLARRVMPVAVAAGEDVAVLGGTASVGALDTARPDGARWIARTATWERLPDAPFGPVAAVWTGDRVIAVSVAGEAASLAFGDTAWTQLPATGLSPRSGAVVEWTGTEVIVWGGWADPCGSGPCTPLSDGATFDPATSTWRPLPAVTGLRTGGGAAWTGTRLVLGDGSAAQGQESRPWRTFDPVARRWATIPAPPGMSALIAADGDRLEAADGGNGQLYTATLPNVQWAPDGQVPSEGQTSVSWGAFIDGHLIVDTGPGTSSGRFVGYRDSSGAWVSIGPGVMTNDDAPLVVTAGRVVGTNGTALSVLQPIEDPTIGAPPCRADQFDTTLDADFLSRRTSIYLYNRSDILCTVSGQRPLDVRFTLDGRTQPVLQPASPFLHQAEDVGGGAVAPGQWARIDLSPWLNSTAGPTGCPADGEITAISFRLASGDTMSVSLDGFRPPSDQCWDLSTIAAVSTANLAPRCDPAVLGSVVTEVADGQEGGFVITLTNNGATPCAVVGRPALEADDGNGSWSVVAPAGPVPYLRAIASTLTPTAQAILRTIGRLPDEQTGTCDETGVAATATRWRLRLGNGWTIPLQHDGLRHRCNAMLSGFEATAG